MSKRGNIRVANDYWGGHRPPSDGAPLHDLTQGGTFPDDVYTHPQYYIHGSGDAYDRESIEVVKSVQGQPNATVTVYRSLPPDAEPTISPGDWVAISEGYARKHGMGRGWDEWVEPADPNWRRDPSVIGPEEAWVRREGDWPVVSAQVRASDVRSGGNDLIEWGYWGSPVRGQVRHGSRKPRLWDKVKQAWRAVTAADGADDQGVMIALVPEEEASQALLDHAKGTEPLENQHLTLAYLGTLGEEIPEDDGIQATLAATLAEVAAEYAPLKGQANGWGMFHNDTDVLIALWNIPGINGLRHQIVKALEEVGLAPKTNFSFTPHQTMAYGEPGEVKQPDRMEEAPTSTFDRLYYTWGDQWHEVPLTGHQREAKKVVAMLPPPQVMDAMDVLEDPARLAEFVAQHDHGSGCDDIARAVEEQFGVPQVYGTFAWRGGQHDHSWNEADGWIVDGARYVFDGEGAHALIATRTSAEAEGYSDETAGDYSGWSLGALTGQEQP